MRPRGRRNQSEEGAVLLLVLFFVLGIGLSLGALVTLSATNLSATTQLKGERNIEFSADAVVDGAIQAVRPVASSGAVCPTFPSGGSGLKVNVNTEAISATCSMGILIPSGTTTETRNVQFVACPTSTLSACLTNAILIATVQYTDTGCPPFSDVGCTTKYGSIVTIENWTVVRANG